LGGDTLDFEGKGSNSDEGTDSLVLTVFAILESGGFKDEFGWHGMRQDRFYLIGGLELGKLCKKV
jgi:hypothetical protein